MASGHAVVAQALRSIADHGSPFVVNNAASEKYLALLLWEAAGRPDRSGWWIDTGLRDQDAVEHAATLGAYTLWGVVPFLLLRQSEPNLDLDPLVTSDALFVRMMVSVVPNPDLIAGVDAFGAKSLEAYLIRPETQARIRAFRFPGLDAQIWWPAGRNNSGEYLGSIE